MKTIILLILMGGFCSAGELPRRVTKHKGTELDTEWMHRNDISSGWWRRHGWGLTWNNEGELIPRSERSRKSEDWNYASDFRDLQFLRWWNNLVVIWPKGSSIEGAEELFYQYFQAGYSPSYTLQKYKLER